MSVDAIMHRELVTIAPQEPVTVAVGRMAKHNLGAVLIMDGEHMRGVFSERDLLTRVVAEGRDPATTRVGDVATADVVTVSPETSVRECVALFQDKGFRHLPILGSDGNPVGIISLRDLLSWVAVEFEPMSESEKQLANIGNLYIDVYGG